MGKWHDERRNFEHGRPTISVVMAVWHGERYLPRQLASLVGQTRRPDELVVVDDASGDGTLGIVEDFARTAPFPVRVLRSASRQGSTAAFARGIEEARCDLIALCDQDDLWFPQKLARIEAVFTERPDTTFVFTDALLVDEADVTQPGTMWTRRGFTTVLQDKVRDQPFAQLSHRWLATGCTMAFRTELRDVLLPFPTDVTDIFEPMIHDRWISLVLSPLGPVAVLDEPLVGYRIHPAQQIGMTQVSAAMPFSRRLVNKVVAHRSHIRSARTYQLAHLEEVRRRLGAPGVASLEVIAEVEGAITHLRRRIRNLDGGRGRLLALVRAVLRGDYRHYSRGWASVAVDLLRS